MITGLDSLLSQRSAAANAASNSTGSGTQQTNSLGGGLDPNSFITLLAAQLKAQDPLDPMDPDQMVSELTAMNTLQQTIQMRQDLDALTSGNSNSGSSSSSSSTGGNTSGNAAPTVQVANAYRSGLVTPTAQRAVGAGEV
jgi:flagellar basal-body rod modification protein FlgD